MNTSELVTSNFRLSEEIKKRKKSNQIKNSKIQRFKDIKKGNIYCLIVNETKTEKKKENSC